MGDFLIESIRNLLEKPVGDFPGSVSESSFEGISNEIFERFS